MSKLPKGWEKKTLNDISELTSSKRIYLSDYVEKGVPFFRGKEISQLKKNEKVEDILYISEEKYEEIKQKFGIPVKNDILITAVGTLANTYRIPNNDKFYFKDGNLIWLKNISEYSIYVEYSLNFNKKLLLDSAIGSSQKALTIAELKKIELAFPPIEEQKKIADILSTVDKKIAFVEENINATEELKKGLMQKLLTEGIGHTEFKDSELGRIPESWEVVQFDKVCDIRDGTHDSPKYIESGIPFITSKHLTDNGIDFTETNYISKENHIEFSKRSKVDNGDILFGMIGTIGKPIIVNTDFEFSIKNIALLKLSCNELLSNIYVLNLLKSNIITKQFSKLSNGGVQSFIALGMIRKLKIPLPPLEEQKQIAEILSTVDNKLENLKEKKLFFEELKKGLMQKLLTGEVRI